MEIGGENDFKFAGLRDWMTEEPQNQGTTELQNCKTA